MDKISKLQASHTILLVVATTLFITQLDSQQIARLQMEYLAQRLQWHRESGLMTVRASHTIFLLIFIANTVGNYR